MAVLLVAMGVMAVMLSAAMPVWKQMAQREKEDELIFRGTQYVHAIGLFQRKYMNAYPPNIDTLYEQRFLRKKFKDPITNDDFQPLGAGQVVPGTLQDRVVNGPGQLNSQPSTNTTSGRGGTSSAAGRGGTTTGGTSTGGASPVSPGSPGSTFSTTGPGGSSTPGAGGVAGIMGVVSKSKDKSIRVYNGRTHYNEWAFVYQTQQQVPGGNVPGANVPGQVPVQPGQQQPGQRGQQPFGPGQRGIIPSIERGSPFGPGGPGGPGRGVPPGGFNPFSPQPTMPIQPPPQPGRGRSGG